LGSVILVPPSMRFDTPDTSFGPSSQHQIVPVQFAGQSSMLSATITLPQPKVMNQMYDPMWSYMAFHGMSGRPRVSNRTMNSSPMVHSMEAMAVNKAFWGHAELVEIVKGFHGDLLLQIETQLTDQYGNSNTSRWNFSATDIRDIEAVTGFVGRQKSCRIVTHKEYRGEITDWLRSQCTEYDLFEASTWLHEDEVYIRDDTEAIYFKMKWFGLVPDDKPV
jgi:hypothetical protein